MPPGADRPHCPHATPLYDWHGTGVMAGVMAQDGVNAGMAQDEANDSHVGTMKGLVLTLSLCKKLSTKKRFESPIMLEIVSETEYSIRLSQSTTDKVGTCRRKEKGG